MMDILNPGFRLDCLFLQLPREVDHEQHRGLLSLRNRLRQAGVDVTCVSESQVSGGLALSRISRGCDALLLRNSPSTYVSVSLDPFVLWAD